MRHIKFQLPIDLQIANGAQIYLVHHGNEFLAPNQTINSNSKTHDCNFGFLEGLSDLIENLHFTRGRPNNPSGYGPIYIQVRSQNNAIMARSSNPIFLNTGTKSARASSQRVQQDNEATTSNISLVPTATPPFPFALESPEWNVIQPPGSPISTERFPDTHLNNSFLLNDDSDVASMSLSPTTNFQESGFSNLLENNNYTNMTNENNTSQTESNCLDFENIPLTPLSILEAEEETLGLP